MTRKTYTKKITSPEVLAQINPKNKELVERFLKDKAIRSSDVTIGIYRSNLNIFFAWNLLENKNKLFMEIKKLEFADFFIYFANEHRVGSSRMNNIRSVLSSLSNFVEKFYDEDYPNFRNVILKIVESSPKEVRREKTILSDDQVNGLLQHLASTDKQRACWLALAANSGARFSELLRFDIDTIDETRTAFGDLFLETTKTIKTKGRGKAGKLIYKYIIRDRFIPHFRAWIEERKELLARFELNHKSLFVKTDGSPATAGSVRLWFAEFEDYLKIPFYPHALRHYVVTLFSRRGIPYEIIKDLIGWSSMEMCSVYDDTTAKDRRWKEIEGVKF